MKKYRLPKEFGDNFLTALRSGEYKQGAGALITREPTRNSDIEDDDSGFAKYYCCLGVACVMNGVEEVAMLERGTIPSRKEVEREYKGIQYFKSIPDEIRSGGVEGQGPFLYSALINLNDNEGKSFTEIADWIEDNVEFYQKGTMKKIIDTRAVKKEIKAIHVKGYYNDEGRQELPEGNYFREDNSDLLTFCRCDKAVIISDTLALSYGPEVTDSNDQGGILFIVELEEI
mgnify:CR=1 FL=1